MEQQLYAPLSATIANLDTNSISEERKATLQPLTAYINQKIAEQNHIQLNFICTHNSRRSHLCQVWAQALAYYFGIPNVYCYSGGTEVTALFPKVAETLYSQGFQVNEISQNKNPVYAIKFSDNAHPVIGFSKKFSDNFNPKNNFAAILTCSSADEGCPFIAGAEKRIPITFEDPKHADGTEEMNAVYFQKSIEIATALKFVFENVKM